MSDRHASMSRYETLVWLSATTFATAALIDAATKQQRSLDLCFNSTALALLTGALHGIVCAFTFWLASFLPPRLARVAWQIVFLFLGGWLAHRLNVFDRLEGNYASLARAMLFVCLTAGILLGSLAGALQPSPWGPSSLATRATEQVRARIGWASCLLIGAAVLVTADRTLFIRTYPEAHFALRITALWAAILATACLLPSRASDALLRMRRLVAPGLAAICLTCVFTIDDRNPTLLNAMLARPYPATFLRALRALSDVDRDGYSSILGGGDCAAWDSEIHPGQLEIPSNGRDDNCLLGDGQPLASGTPPSKVPLPPGPAPLSVVLVTLDTVRADHTSLHGHNRETTPELRQWARDAVRFDCAYAAAAGTATSITTVMRGVYNGRLKWRRFAYTTLDRMFLSLPIRERLMPGEESWTTIVPVQDHWARALPFWLRRRGMYTTAVVNDGPQNILIRPVFADSFDLFFDDRQFREPRLDDATTADMAIANLEKLFQQNRFFYWVHFFGVHSPDDVHPGVTTFGSRPEDKYDHEILYLDKQVARFLRAIEEWSARMRSPVAIIVTADHGEQFMPIGRDHAFDLSDESIRVPLVLKAPGLAPGVRQDMVSLADVMPTILGLTETPAPAPLDGIDLRNRPAGPHPTRVLTAQAWRINQDGEMTIDKLAAFDQTGHLTLDVLDNTRSWAQPSDPRFAGPCRRFDSNPASRARIEQTLLQYIESTGGSVPFERTGQSPGRPELDRTP